MLRNFIIQVVRSDCLDTFVDWQRKRFRNIKYDFKFLKLSIGKNYGQLLFCVPSMALILLVQVQSWVFTAKCSEPQVGIGNGMDGGSGVAKFLSLRTET